MGRLFGLILMISAVWVGLEIYNEGMDGAFGGRFAGWMGPIESQYERDVPYGSHLTPVAQTGDAPSAPRREPITEHVRRRVTSHLEESAARHSGE